jgi:hypothetical protein
MICSVYLAIRSISCDRLNEANQIDQTDQIDQRDLASKKLWNQIFRAALQ